MGRIVVSVFISLDGVIEDPGGAEKSEHGGWAFRFDSGPEGRKFKFDELTAAGAMLVGRTTYEGFAAVWPTMTDQGPFADRMNAMPKYVVSSTLDHADWNNTTVLSGDVASEVVRLAKETDGEILVAGSAQLVGTLLTLHLVDELRLMVYPIVLGRGKRLFSEGLPATALRILESTRMGDCTLTTYAPAVPQ